MRRQIIAFAQKHGKVNLGNYVPMSFIFLQKLTGFLYSRVFADCLSIPLDLLTNCPFLEIHKIWKNYFVYRHIYHTKQCTFLMRGKPFQDILFFNNKTQDLNLSCFLFSFFFHVRYQKVQKFKSSH